jgi:hypothetical protein
METQQQSTPNATPKPAGQNFFKQMENFFDTYLHKKVPFNLPPNVKEWIVKFGPWITLVLMVLAIPAILLALGLTAVVTPYAMTYGTYGTYGAHYYNPLLTLSGIIALVALIMEAMALPGLFKRSLKGWHLVYYAVLVSAIGQLISGQIVSLIINVVVSMYFLFQIREYYK